MRQSELKEIRSPKWRNPKDARSPKPEAVGHPQAGTVGSRKLRPNCLSGFRFRSSFGFRISDFGFRAALLLCLAFSPARLWACAACTGRTDSPLAVAMNWGIFTLLGVVLTVLSGVLVFFVHVIRNEETASNDTTPQNPPDA
jgi:hypothetical protein